MQWRKSLKTHTHTIKNKCYACMWEKKFQKKIQTT